MAGLVVCALESAEALRTCGTAACAADKVVSAGADALGAGDAEADGDGRGLLRLVALVNVGCIVEIGGRTFMLPGPTGVGGSVDEKSPDGVELAVIAAGDAGIDCANVDGEGLGGTSFFFFASSAAEAPGVPGNGCLRGRPRPLCTGGPGVSPDKALIPFAEAEGVEGPDSEP